MPTPPPELLWISIKPQYAALILSGEKRVELRRTRPRTPPEGQVLLYASSPSKSLVGLAVIDAVEADDPTRLWPQVQSHAGVCRPAYDDYFAGASQAVAIWLTDVRPLERPLSLDEIRRRWPTFHPPQSYRYIPSQHACQLQLGQATP